MYVVGIPAAVCAIAGNFLGARLAVKKGAGFIRPMVLVAVGLLFVKIVVDLF